MCNVTTEQLQAVAAAIVSLKYTSPTKTTSISQELSQAPAHKQILETPLSLPSSPRDSDDSDAAPEQEHQHIPESEIREWDVLCGRGGKSNHHPGNKRYRQVVGELKNKYRGVSTTKDKTALSRAIVDHVNAYGGRFLKKDAKTKTYFVLTQREARRKASQALRETKELKWTL